MAQDTFSYLVCTKVDWASQVHVYQRKFTLGFPDPLQDVTLLNSEATYRIVTQ